MTLVGHSDNKYITGTRLRSSVACDWGTMLAETWCHKEGRLRDIKPRETEIAIVLDGHAKVRRHGDGETQLCDATSGTVWICPAGVEETNIRLYGDLDQVLHLYIPEDPFTKSALCDFDIDPLQASLRYKGGFQDPFIKQVGMIILDEMKTPSPISALRIESLQVGLAAHLLSQYSVLNSDKAKLPNLVGALDTQRLARVVEFIHANLERNIKLGEMAAVACLSPHHFSRAFKISTGETPHRYLVEKRLSNSKDLLRAGTHSLSHIALKAGFSNQSHFTRVFKETTGMTPGAYRRTG